MPHVEEQSQPAPKPAGRPLGAARRPALPKDTPRLEGTLVRIHEAGYGFIRVVTPSGQEEYYINIGSMRDRSAWAPGRVLSFLPGQPRTDRATPAYDARAVKPRPENNSRRSGNREDSNASSAA